MGAYSASVGTLREAVAAGAPVEQARRRAAYSDQQREQAAGRRLSGLEVR